MSKLLVFDIWGDYAHFRKPYTTTSPLTYSIPSRTALTGIIGAILGIEKEENNELLNYSRCNLGLKILNPIKKTIINQNLIDTKTSKMMARMKPKGGRTQIRFEKLKNPKYRIYIEIFDESLYEKLKNNLINHTPIYTPCFGISEDLANFEFIGEFDYNLESGCVYLDSVVNMEEVNQQNIEFENEKEYFVDTYPLEMKRNREVLKFGEVLIERQGNKIHLKDTAYISLSIGENIKWL